MDAFVHASGDGFGNTAPLHSDTGAIDMDAISQVAHVTQGAGKLTRKEKKHAKREMKRRKKEAKKAEKEAKKTYSSIKSQLKEARLRERRGELHRLQQDVSGRHL